MDIFNIKRISKGQIPPLDKYVLIYSSARPWHDSTDPEGVFWRVAKLVKVIDYDNREHYFFDEFGPDNHRFESIDIWCNLPHLKNNK